MMEIGFPLNHRKRQLALVPLFMKRKTGRRFHTCHAYSIRNEVNVRIEVSGSEMLTTRYLICADEKLGPAIPLWAFVFIFKGDMLGVPATVFMVKPQSFCAYTFF